VYASRLLPELPPSHPSPKVCLMTTTIWLVLFVVDTHARTHAHTHTYTYPCFFHVVVVAASRHSISARNTTTPSKSSANNPHPRPSKDLELSPKHTAKGTTCSTQQGGLTFRPVFHRHLLFPRIPLALAHLRTCCPTACQLPVAYMHTKWCRCPHSHHPTVYR